MYSMCVILSLFSVLSHRVGALQISIIIIIIVGTACYFSTSFCFERLSFICFISPYLNLFICSKVTLIKKLKSMDLSNGLELFASKVAQCMNNYVQHSLATVSKNVIVCVITELLLAKYNTPTVIACSLQNRLLSQNTLRTYNSPHKLRPVIWFWQLSIASVLTSLCKPYQPCWWYGTGPTWAEILQAVWTKLAGRLVPVDLIL